MSENDVRESSKTPHTEPGPKGPFSPRNLVLAAFTALIVLGAIAANATGGDGSAGDKPPAADSAAVEQSTRDDLELPRPGGQGGEEELPGLDGTKPKPVPDEGGEPAGGKPAARPVAVVVADGVELEQVASAPPKTLSRVKMPEGIEYGEYTLVFQPFGWAPDGPEGKRLVVKVIESNSSDGRLQDLADRNMLLGVSSYDGEPITTGGRYSGRVEVLADGEGRGTFFLRSATSAR